MKVLLLQLLLCFLILPFAVAQDSIPMVRYDKNYRFRDGVYLTFEEWKSGHPRITVFQAVRTNAMGAQSNIDLRYNCTNDEGQVSVCTVNKCFAYVMNGALYIAQGYYGYYYRAFLIGSLTHFIAFSGYDHRDRMYYIDPNSLLGSENDLSEYLLDFESGTIFPFNFRSFSEFLKEKDTDLYNELMQSKQKRRMIHHFLLRYNEKHPVYFPDTRD